MSENSDSGVTITAKVSEVTPNVSHSHNAVTPVASYLGIKDASDDETQQMQRIAEYFRGDKKEYTDMQLLMEIRHLEHKLGMPSIGETRLNQLYRYVTINGQIRSLESERDRMMR